MARPKRDNADYHTHDKDMRNSKRIKALRKKFSHLGYSIYNMILEVLTDADHFRHVWDELNIELLAGDFDIEADKLVEIVNYCVRLELLSVEDGYIFSFEHINRFNRLLSKRKRDNTEVSGSLTAGNELKEEFPAVSVVENPQSIVKNSKLNKSKDVTKVEYPLLSEKSLKQVGVGSDASASGPPPPKIFSGNKKNRLENPDTIQPVQDYFSEKMRGKWPPSRIEIEAQKFFYHYSSNGWVQNKNKPIVNWKMAVNNWILNEVNGVYSNPARPKDHQAPAISTTTQPPPEEKKLSEAEKMQLSRDFMQDTFTDFCNSQMGLLSKEVFAYYYNQLVTDGLLILTEADKERIKKDAGGDLKKSKIIAVEEYFTRLKSEGVKFIYQHAVN